MKATLLLFLALVVFGAEDSATETFSSSVIEDSDLDEDQPQKVPEGAMPKRSASTKPVLTRSASAPALTRSSSTKGAQPKTSTNVQSLGSASTPAPAVSLATLRAEFVGQDTLSDPVAAARTTFKKIFDFVKATNPPVIHQTKAGFVAAHQKEGKFASASAAEADIDAGKSRGFTGADGVIHIWAQNKEQGEHDEVHEITHVASADGGKTLIQKDFSNTFNEVFTEYWTKQFLGVCSASDYPAYIEPYTFGLALAKIVGVPIMHRVFLQNQGAQVLIDALYTYWNANQPASKIHKPDPSAAKAKAFLASKLKSTADSFTNSVVWGWWAKAFPAFATDFVCPTK